MGSPVARAAIVWLGVVVIFYLKTQLGIALFGPSYSVPRHVIMAIAATALTVPFVVLACRYLDREPLASLGLQLDWRALRPFAVGVLAWLIPFLLAVTVCLFAGWVRIVPSAGWYEVLAFLPALIVLVFLLEALPEELAFRGYIYTNLASAMPRGLAVAVQAALFALWGAGLHALALEVIPVERLIVFLAMGAVVGVLRAMSGSVWAGIGFHLAFQTVAQLLLNAERGHFEIAGVGVLQAVALGWVPFALAITIAGTVYRGPHAWGGREGISSSAGSAGPR